METTVVSTMRKQYYSLQKIPSYATAHLLHQVCSAFCRHADSRVNNRFQRPGAEQRLILYASLSRPSTPWRVPASRHWYFCRIWWQGHIICLSCQVRHDRQSTYSQRLNILPSYNTPPLAVCSLPTSGYYILEENAMQYCNIRGFIVSHTGLNAHYSFAFRSFNLTK